MFISTIRADGMGDRSPFGGFFFNPLGGLTRSGVNVTASSSMGLPTVWACIRLLSESFAVMPFCLYQPKVGGGRSRITTHWLYRLFAKSPNRFQTPYEWRLMLQGHLALRGNAFCQITANGNGEITELLPLHPDRMSVEMLDNGSYRYAYRAQNGETIYYARTEVWHLRGLSGDGIMGMSPIELARDSIAEGLSIQGYSARFFANDAKPGGGWIEFPGSFANKDAKKVFRESWQEMQGGNNRGKVAVLEKGMKFHEVGLTNKDSQFIEARADKRKDIASIWRVQPHKVGIMDDATFSNIESQAIEFWTDTMLPYAELWESSVEYFLLGADEPLGLETEFDMGRMMRGDSVARSSYYTSGINSGWLTRNEAREAEGYDPIDGLDEPLRPLNMVEESQAADELAEGDGGADDSTGNDANARRANRRMRRAEAKKSMLASAKQRSEKAQEMPERMAALLQANAARLARRYAKGLSAEVVAEAMAVSPHAAQLWCAVNRDGSSEESIAASLVEMAGAFRGALPAPAPVINVTVAQPVNNISVQPPSIKVDAPITNNLPPAQVNVAAPEVSVAAPNVHVDVAAPEVQVKMPDQPWFSVSVAAPDVHVDNHAAAAPNVNVNVEPPKQADKPWPTRTTIKKRDDQGRADVIETTPIG